MIPINGNLFTETFISSMGILILSLIVVRVIPFSLKTFQSIYLIMGASNIAVHYFYIENVSILFPVVSLVVGVGIMFLFIGIFGKLKTSAHYEALLVSIGLFPWYLGIIESLIYILLSIILILGIYILKQKRASKKYEILVKDFPNAESILNEKDLPKFNKIINGIYTTPIGVAAIISMIYYSLII